ncbi:MAG: hypothetical protein J7647_00790 [Cyanobacteria bacterium SBLK]|nr:hypothetical protein [Cyanobacteria bacterium SBLK]
MAVPYSDISDRLKTYRDVACNTPTDGMEKHPIQYRFGIIIQISGYCLVAGMTLKSLGDVSGVKKKVGTVKSIQFKSQKFLIIVILTLAVAIAFGTIPN